MNASPAAVPSTASTGGGPARATSSPPSSSTAPSAPSVTAVSTPDVTGDLVLEPVDDEEVRLDVDRASRRGVEAEEARLLGGRPHDVVGDLQLAEDGVRVAHVDVACLELAHWRRARRRSSSPRRQRPRSARRPWAHRAPRRATRLQPHAARPVLPRRRVAAYGSGERHVGSEPTGRDGLVGTLAARETRERRARQRLPWPGKPFAVYHEVEVDRPDDRDVGRTHAASARRSSTARSRRFSRRSNSPAHKELRSGGHPTRARSASPSSARTSTASSRYAWATRYGAA